MTNQPFPPEYNIWQPDESEFETMLATLQLDVADMKREFEANKEQPESKRDKPGTLIDEGVDDD